MIEALQTRGAPETTPGQPGGSSGEGAPPSPDPAEEPPGPPGPDGPSAEYRGPGVEDHSLPEPVEPAAAEPAPVAPPEPGEPARINSSTRARLKAFLRTELGDVASEAEEVALLSAILGYPVQGLDYLTPDEGQSGRAGLQPLPRRLVRSGSST